MTTQPLQLPVQSKFTFDFSRHHGPAFSAGTVTIQTHNSEALVVTAFRDASASPYADDVLAGVRSALATIGSQRIAVDILAIGSHDVHSSHDSMYRCGYGAIMAMACCACAPTRNA